MLGSRIIGAIAARRMCAAFLLEFARGSLASQPSSSEIVTAPAAAAAAGWPAAAIAEDFGGVVGNGSTFDGNDNVSTADAALTNEADYTLMTTVATSTTTTSARSQVAVVILTTVSLPVEARATTAQVSGPVFGMTGDAIASTTVDLTDHTSMTIIETSEAATSEMTEAIRTTEIFSQLDSAPPTATSTTATPTPTTLPTATLPTTTLPTTTLPTTTLPTTTPTTTTPTTTTLPTTTLPTTTLPTTTPTTTTPTTTTPTTTTPSTARVYYGAWSNWSDCDHTCDGGMQTMVCIENATLLESSDYCESAAQQFRLCNVEVCQVDPSEEENGVNVILKTSLGREQYVQIRDSMREAIGRAIINFCNASVNYAICCPLQSPGSFQSQRSTKLDSLIIKRAPQSYNDSMTIFVVLASTASAELCIDSETANAGLRAAPAKRAAMTYLPPTLLGHLLESGVLAQSLVDAIQSRFPNVGASAVTWPPSPATTSATKVKSAMTTPNFCQTLMEFSAESRTCVYSGLFYVAVLSPNAVLLITIVIIFSVCTLKRRKVRRARAKLTALESRANKQQADLRQHWVASPGSSGFEAAASSAPKAELHYETADGHYANMSTFHSGQQRSESPNASNLMRLPSAVRNTYVDFDQYVEQSSNIGRNSHDRQPQSPGHLSLPQLENTGEPDSHYENRQLASDYANLTFGSRGDAATLEEEDPYESIT